MNSTPCSHYAGHIFILKLAVITKKLNKFDCLIGYWNVCWLWYLNRALCIIGNLSARGIFNLIIIPFERHFTILGQGNAQNMSRYCTVFFITKHNNWPVKISSGIKIKEIKRLKIDFTACFTGVFLNNRQTCSDIMRTLFLTRLFGNVGAEGRITLSTG